MAKSSKPRKKRPTKYTPSVCTKMIAFFSGEAYKTLNTDTMTEYYRDGSIKKEATRGRLVPNALPTFFRFAESIGVAQSRFVDWASKYPAFAEAFTRAKEMQKEFLMNVALAGIAPPSAFIFIASNITDMRTRGISPDELDPAAFLVPVIIQAGARRPTPTEEPKKVSMRDITLKTLPEHEEVTGAK